MSKTETVAEPYSKKWGRINWFRENKVTPVEFSNTRIDVTPYNERLYGPKIMRGWIIGSDMYHPKQLRFDIRVNNVTYQVWPMEDPNFRIVSYEEIESSKDLITI